MLKVKTLPRPIKKPLGKMKMKELINVNDVKNDALIPIFLDKASQSIGKGFNKKACARAVSD